MLTQFNCGNLHRSSAISGLANVELFLNVLYNKDYCFFLLLLKKKLTKLIKMIDNVY